MRGTGTVGSVSPSRTMCPSGTGPAVRSGHSPTRTMCPSKLARGAGFRSLGTAQCVRRRLIHLGEPRTAHVHSCPRRRRGAVSPDDPLRTPNGPFPVGFLHRPGGNAGPFFVVRRRVAAAGVGKGVLAAAAVLPNRHWPDPSVGSVAQRTVKFRRNRRRRRCGPVGRRGPPVVYRSAGAGPAVAPGSSAVGTTVCVSSSVPPSISVSAR